MDFIRWLQKCVAHRAQHLLVEQFEATHFINPDAAVKQAEKEFAEVLRLTADILDPPTVN